VGLNIAGLLQFAHINSRNMRELAAQINNY